MTRLVTYSVTWVGLNSRSSTSQDEWWLARTQRQRRARAEQEARAAAMAKAQLERDFQRDLPQIKQLLRPLIVEAYTQPGKRGLFVPADTKGPVSLGKLRSIGVLFPTVKGRGGMYYLLGNATKRDRGAFPHYVNSARASDVVMPTMIRVQELVEKYGHLMVEKGMLAE